MKYNNHKVKVGNKIRWFGEIYKVAALREKQNGFIIEYPGGWSGDEPGLDPNKHYYYIDFAYPNYNVVNFVWETEV